MSWRQARSIATLRGQLDARWPDRSKAADGTIGDTAHQARTSDHNPNDDGVVTAVDVTHDPAHGADMAVLAEELRAAKDERTAYVIWDRQIFDGPHKSGTGGGGVDPWTWRPYDGDPHTGHLHLSVAAPRRRYDNPRKWKLRARAERAGVMLRRGDYGRAVKTLQRWLAALGLYDGAIDGQFGPRTEDAVNAVKRRRDLPADGVVGERVWELWRQREKGHR